MAELVVIGYPDETTAQRARDTAIRDWRKPSRETG
jgi:hypothetical protein